MSQVCTDKVVSEILAGWRYDISGLAPEMRVDYEQHFRDCAYCGGKRRLHRMADFAVLFLAMGSALVFLLAFGLIRHFNPARALWLEIGAGIGFAASIVVWVIVMVSTPVPVVAKGLALAQARRLHEKLPEEIKNKIPENLAAKIAE
ncbi:MAG TPA: hypothetical protein VMZ25_06335 [Terriglobales bacterium]|nr:hypothetical protein [Terriglobales bacterium]